MNSFTPYQDHSLQQGIFPLPIEIVCRIFLASLSDSPFNEFKRDDYGDILMSFSASRMTTPFTLGAVCRRWRAIAFREPLLWHSVYLVAVPHKAGRQAHLLGDWLARSGNLPLTIEIDCSNDDSKNWFPDDQDEALTLLATVFKYSTRCTTFRTRLPPACLLLPPRHFNIPDPQFSNLTTLSVVPRGLSFEDEDEDVDIIDLFKDAGNLQQVDIHEVEFRQLTISWVNVVKVTTTVSLNDCIKILRAAPNIEECEFNGITFFGDDFDTTPILSPRLHTLVLDFGELYSTQDHITHILTAPNLRKLEYITQHKDDFPVQNFVSFVERSQCHITDLTIQNPSMSVADVQACLIRPEVAPSLQNLYLKLLSDEENSIVTLKPPRQIMFNAFPSLQASTFSGPATTIYPFFNITIPASQPQH